jgi:hypothetical protein
VLVTIRHLQYRMNIFVLHLIYIHTLISAILPISHYYYCSTNILNSCNNSLDFTCNSGFTSLFICVVLSKIGNINKFNRTTYRIFQPPILYIIFIINKEHSQHKNHITLYHNYFIYSTSIYSKTVLLLFALSILNYMEKYSNHDSRIN